MAYQSGHNRVCPTRTDGNPALFVHRVTPAQCRDKQRGRFHKCYTCAYNNAYVAAHGTPEEREQREAQAAAALAREASLPKAEPRALPEPSPVAKVV